MSEATNSQTEISANYEDNEDIQMFREYLQIPSIVSDEYDYVPCVEFIKKQAATLDLSIQLFYPCGPTKPIVILEWEGTIPVLPKIVLNSHMDVVPAIEKYWTHPPFSADIDEEGLIFARGSQDMKCSAMQYLSAIRLLKSEEVRLKRTILIMFVPDEENNGKYGMQQFVNTAEFKRLKIGFVLDEGGPTPGEEFNVYFAERAVWHLRFKIPGTAGHSAFLLKQTAGEKVRYLLDKFMDYRAKEIKRLEENPKLNIGDVTTINLTIMNGGFQDNVIPTDLTICFDCRLTLLVNHIKFEAMIRKWMDEAGGGIELYFDHKDPNSPPTILEHNPFWNGFKQAMDELKLKISVKIGGGATDSRYIRQAGIPAIGFSALNHTPPRTHQFNECIAAETYLKGIEIWKKIILNVGNAKF